MAQGAQSSSVRETQGKFKLDVRKEPLFPPSPPRPSSRLDRAGEGGVAGWDGSSRDRMDQQSMSVRERLEEALSTSIGTPVAKSPTPTPTRKSSAELVARVRRSRTPSVTTAGSVAEEGTREPELEHGVSRIVVRKPNSDGLLAVTQNHGRRSSRASWTGFGFWNSGKPDPPKLETPTSAQSRSRSGSVFSQHPAAAGKRTVESRAFEPAATGPVVASQTSLAHASPYTQLSIEEDTTFRTGDGGSPPSFRAIVQATRILTNDPTSIIRTQRHRGGELVRSKKDATQEETKVVRLAQRLVENAKLQGVGVKASRLRSGSNETDSKRKAQEGGKGTRIDNGDGGQARQALLRTLSALPPVFPDGVPPAAQGRAARSASIVSVLEASTGRRRSRTTTVNSTSGGSKSPGPGGGRSEPGVGDPVDAVHAVPMEPMMNPSERPPPMLVRRATADDFLPPPAEAHQTGHLKHAKAKIPSRFGEDVAELEPYIDRYGFVYHLKYVQMLLDLQQGLSDVEEPEEVAVVEDPPAVAHTVETSPGKVTVGRHRSASIATFNPSPGRPTLSSADEMVTVPPPSMAAGSGSIRLRKAKLDQLAAKYRKPLVSLLGQLAEMHDKQEQERMKRWHQFLKYRRRKLPSSARPKEHEGGWNDDLIGVANLGDGKIGRDLMKRFIALVHNTGIPIALRASVWAECSGAKDAFTPGEYQEILAVHQGDQHPTLVEIEKDVRRTFPTNVFFGGDGVGCEKLRRVLSAYAWRDPQIGYCQGMNLIAATLLLTYDDEEQAYWTFVSIIKNMLPDDWFTASLQGSMIEQAVIGDLVDTLLPDVAAHLQDLEVELSAITFGWILSLFASCLPIETLLRVWDVFLVEGRDVIPCTVIAVLKLGEQGILNCENVGELFEYLNTITERLWTADKLVLLQERFKASITSAELDRRRKEHLEMIASTAEVSGK